MSVGGPLLWRQWSVALQPNPSLVLHMVSLGGAVARPGLAWAHSLVHSFTRSSFS